MRNLQEQVKKAFCYQNTMSSTRIFKGPQIIVVPTQIFGPSDGTAGGKGRGNQGTIFCP